MKLSIILIGFLAVIALSFVESSQGYKLGGFPDKNMHPKNHYEISSKTNKGKMKEHVKELDGDYWSGRAQDFLEDKLNMLQVVQKAKNVILFIGDGMSVATLTAARILKGQKVDNKANGEETYFTVDKFPFTGVSRTYCVDAQVPDSACTANAFMTGVKNNEGTLGITASVKRGDCEGQQDTNSHLSSLFTWAQEAGKATGIVTTARVTHATPAAGYAHIADRDWENDAEVKQQCGENSQVQDIAQQLVSNEPGKNLNVILGGGRGSFFPKDFEDPENQENYREDNRNLVEEWKKVHEENKAAYVTSVNELKDVKEAEVTHLLGLFESSHVSYYHEQEEHNDPTLKDMVEKAIKIMARKPEGFLMMVESGRIDHAHHDTMAQKALWETIEFMKAVEAADELTGDQETLIVLTSDHGHVMTINGYPRRGNPITSFATEGIDSLPITTLSYANGPGYKNYTDNIRYDASSDPTDHIDYQFMTMAPLEIESHSGTDVLVFAKGPFSHIFTGVFEQNYIPHAISYASCIGPGKKYCSSSTESFANLSFRPLLPIGFFIPVVFTIHSFFCSGF